jgi:hypothetical protein
LSPLADGAKLKLLASGVIGVEGVDIDDDGVISPPLFSLLLFWATNDGKLLCNSFKSSIAYRTSIGGNI